MIEFGSISGVVSDITGRAVVDAAVFIVGDCPEHPDILVLTDMNGHYLLDHLAGGLYIVMVYAEGKKPLNAEIVVEPGHNSRLDFVISY